MLLGFKALTVRPLLYQSSDGALDPSILLRSLQHDVVLFVAIIAQGGGYKLGRLILAHNAGPQQERGLVTRARVLSGAINACSRSDVAVVALLLLKSCYPSSSGAWQSITRAKIF